jgi:glycosyltransferase involved in cell wall biosynthesis
MRILTLTNLYPNPYQPSRATFNRQQLRVLAEGHDVQVIAPVAWTDELLARHAGEPPLPKGRRTSLDGLKVDHPRYYFTPKFGRRWYGRWFEMSAAATFDRVVEELRPDVVFAPWAYPDGWAAVRLGRRHGLPVVVKCHGSDILLLDQHPSRRTPTIEAVCRADGVVAVSRNLGDQLLHLGVQPEKVRTIVDGVDLQRFRPGDKSEARTRVGLGDGPPTVLFVGNLVPVKSVDTLIAACARLRQSGFAHRLAIVGDGPLRGELARQAEQMKVSDCVSFLGVRPHDELPDWFRAADLFVLPSRSEGIPSVLLEASGCETPWVATAVGGIPEIASFGRSALVKPDAPEELAEAIRAALLDPPSQPRSGPRSQTDSVAELADFLQSVLDRRHGVVRQTLVMS